MLPDIYNNWLLMALLAPLAFSISCVVDVCCVGERIFRYPSDGPIVSCLFWVLPLSVVLLGVGGWHYVTLENSMPALLSGLCYFLQIYFYYRALFVENDASRAEVFNSLSVLFVPVLAFVLIGEKLSPVLYVAISLALAGVIILLRGILSSAGRTSVLLLTVSVFFGSLSMVLDAWVFDQMPYWNGVILTALGSFLSALGVAITSRRRSRRIIALCWRLGWLFMLAELIHLFGAVAGQRATAIGPSVSLVALAECTQPLFVMALSLLLAAGARYGSRISLDMRQALALQTIGAPAKFASMSLIGLAVFITQI